MLETIALNLLLKASQEPKETSTVRLGEELEVSQQSVSRVLIDLEAQGLITKRTSATGLALTLTQKGRAQLVGLHERLDAALHTKGALRLIGIIETGIGEGKYYLSLEGYREPLMGLLGGELYPGTLNLRVDEDEKTRFLATIPMTKIPGWTSKERTYGPVAFYPVRVGDLDCGIIMPMRTTHGPGKIEIVATRPLRAHYKTKDGDALVVEQRGA